MSGEETRETVIERALADYDDGHYMEELRRRVAIPTESQNPERLPDLYRYLNEEIGPAFEGMGYAWRVFDNPFEGQGPVLLAERVEDASLPTVLGYGHGDVIRGYEDQWREGLGPWDIVAEGDRFYGRGTADNKAQHTVHMRALKCLLDTRGRLGFNSKFLVETGEENGSKGLEEIVRDNRDAFSADAFIASDGPRVSVERANITLGNRGAVNFDLLCELREGGHHSGNWGGLLANPGIILAHAIASITTAKGRIQIPEWLPCPIPNSVRDALKDVARQGGPGAPEMDLAWGEPHPSRESLRLEHLRGTRLSYRESRQPGKRRPAEGHGALPDSLRCGLQCRRLPAGPAQTSGCPRLSAGEHSAAACRECRRLQARAHRSRSPLGALGCRIHRTHDR